MVADIVVGVFGVKLVMTHGSSGCVPRLLLFALSILMCVSTPM